MQFRSLLLLAGLLSLVFGLAFLLAPAPTLGLYAVTTDAAGLLMARFFGAALLELGCVFILVRGVTETSARRGIALGASLGALAGLIVALLGQLSGMTNALGWSSVVIYLVLAAGFARFAFGTPREA